MREIENIKKKNTQIKFLKVKMSEMRETLG